MIMVIRMTKQLKILLALLSLSLLSVSCKKTEDPTSPTQDPTLAPACDWIGGGGNQTKGGNGGKVYVITTLTDELDDDGYEDAGSLRYAVEATGARTIIFRVAGTIHLRKPLVIGDKNGSITIAGQTAPGDGICIADYPLQIKNANEVIVRFLRFRMGEKGSVDKKTEYDAISVNDCNNVVLDHLSCSWSVDECVSCYGNTNFTMQYCFITESLRNSVHGKGKHGYGGIWGGKNATFHHNLLAHHDSRNPRFDHDYVNAIYAGPIDYVNNVVYNWGGNSTYGGEGTTHGAGGRRINMVNNYYKPGKATKATNRLVDPTVSCADYCIAHVGGTLDPGKFFLLGNYMYGDEEVTNDNWKGSTQQGKNVEATARWTNGLTALKNEQTATEAYETVLAKAGCSLQRDAIDERIVTEVKNGNYTYSGSNGSTGGLIDTPSDVGGWPEYKGSAAADTDGDGIPDAWEEAHGLNPKSYADSKQEDLVSGYTNFEVYLNAIVAHLY